MHSIHGWYTGTSIDRYWAFKICTKETKAEIICDTVLLLHKYLTQPTVTAADVVVKSLKVLEEYFRGYIPQNKGQMDAL